jgi:thiol:disulfide interchange protein
MRVQKKRSTLFILAGIAFILFAVYSWKSVGDTSVASKLEQQLDQALKGGQPAFVFLHSLNCVACKEMMAIVDQVYPEYQDAVVLIDVDVYEQSNADLLKREQVQSIPTLVFYDAEGARQVFIDAMPAEQFRDTLSQLVANQ